MSDTISPEWRDYWERRERNLEAEIETLRALLAEADRAIVWETAMPDGASFQTRIEAALSVKK